jgi:hypothetical protein
VKQIDDNPDGDARGHSVIEHKERAHKHHHAQQG